jgi:hypothetical protein
MLPVFGRPRCGPNPVRTHRDARSSQQINVYVSGCYLVERHVDLLCDPDSMQQDGKLSSDGHHGSSSRMASATGTQAETPSSQG